MSYFTGVGGWSFQFGDGPPNFASYYEGPALALPGAVAGFAASVMFAGRALTTPAAAGALFGNFQDGMGVGPNSGWEIQVNASAGGLSVRALVGSAGAIDAAEAAGAVVPLARPFDIATLVYDDAADELRLYMNGTTKVVAAAANVYVPATGSPAIGLRSLAEGLPAFGQYILGAAYVESVLTDEQVFRHQLVCLEAGDMVDGALGGAFTAPTGPTIQVFSHLYSAARGNNGIGVPVSSYVGASQGGELLGVLPPAIPTWLDEKTPAVNFNKVITNNGQLFTTGFKRVG
jgi:hypothetical protein